MLLNETVPQWVIDITVDVSIMAAELILFIYRQLKVFTCEFALCFFLSNLTH